MSWFLEQEQSQPSCLFSPHWSNHSDPRLNKSVVPTKTTSQNSSGSRSRQQLHGRSPVLYKNSVSLGQSATDGCSGVLASDMTIFVVFVKIRVRFGHNGKIKRSKQQTNGLKTRLYGRFGQIDKTDTWGRDMESS